MSRVATGATAFANRTSPYIVNCIARTPRAAELPRHASWARAAREAMAPYGNDRMYVNFTGEGDEDVVRRSYPGATYRRLQAVKDRLDPGNLFRFNQNIRPSGSA
jgi:FAD/FMN-containing dehydrogenase